jgi:hypothetical protein
VIVSHAQARHQAASQPAAAVAGPADPDHDQRQARPRQQLVGCRIGQTSGSQQHRQSPRYPFRCQTCQRQDARVRSSARVDPLTRACVVRGTFAGRRRPLCVRGCRVSGSARSTNEHGPTHGRGRKRPRTGWWERLRRPSTELSDSDLASQDSSRTYMTGVPTGRTALGGASFDEPRATRPQNSPRSMGGSPSGKAGCRPSRCSYTDRMSAMREELHHLVDELPEAEVRPVLELIRRRADAAHSVRDLPFFASFESDPDLAEKSEEILRAELGR